MNNKVSQDEKEIKLSSIGKIVTGLVFLLVVVIALLVYVFDFRSNKIIKSTLNFIPYPAVIIDYKNMITVNELDDNLRSVRNFYEKQDFAKIGLRIDFSTDDGQKRLKLKEKIILNRMIEDKVIADLAKEAGIKVTDELVNQELARKMDEYGTNVDKFLTKIYTLYGWDLNDFQENVVKPSIVREELSKWFVEDTKDELASGKERIGQAKNKIDRGEHFVDVIEEFSDMPSVSIEELKWVRPALIMPVLAERLQEMKERDVSGVIESETGFHILKLEERKVDELGEMMRFHQVFIRKPSFSIWLVDNFKQANILIPLGGYRWNNQRPGVEFTDEELIEFESNSLENIAADPTNILSL